MKAFKNLYLRCEGIWRSVRYMLGYCHYLLLFICFSYSMTCRRGAQKNREQGMDGEFRGPWYSLGSWECREQRLGYVGQLDPQSWKIDSQVGWGH